MEHTCGYHPWEVEPKNQGFQVIFSYFVELRPTWAMRPCLKKLKTNIQQANVRDNKIAVPRDLPLLQFYHNSHCFQSVIYNVLDWIFFFSF